MSTESNQNKKRIIEFIERHNELYPEDLIGVYSANEVKNVSDLYICVYNDNQVGLFSKLNMCTKLSNRDHFGYGRYLYSTIHYNAENIYIGYNSNYVGVKLLHQEQHRVDEWKKVGYATTWDNKTYLTNCDMYNEMSFDDMRLLMYEDGELTIPYEIGKATQEEILHTLLYAKRYYAGKIQKKK